MPKKTNPLVIIGIIIAFIFIANKAGFFGALVPSTTPMLIKSIEEVETQDEFIIPYDSGNAYSPATLDFQMNAFTAYGAYNYPEDIYTQNTILDTLASFRVSVSGNNIIIQEGYYLNISYDNDVNNVLSLYFPEIRFSTAGAFCCLYFADDGSSYRDSDLTDLAYAAPEPPEDEIPCTPNCNGKECGDDGCGGSCGTCISGYYCSNGQCLEQQTGEGVCEPLQPGDTFCYSILDEATCSASDCIWVVGGCTPNYQCGAYGECVDGIQSRLCQDLNGCDDDYYQSQTCSVSGCTTSEILLGYLDDWVNNIITDNQLLAYIGDWINCEG